MKKYALVASLVAMVIAFANLAGAQSRQADPFTGTWKLDIAKSKFQPGPAPKNETVTVALDGKTTIAGVDQNGNANSWSFTPSGDAAVPIEGRENSTVSHKRTGNVVEDTWNFDGEKIKGRGVISNSGKTVTYTQTGTDKEGHQIHNVRVYERASS